ncbi:Oidioi.mRNA.OKI2018_I69.XSR.g13641.t1.cds [Oikopleura dioica]|uniref:S-methyl-5'-thioadenosine phosphorylase n=1 Tax=Oikopleura dioica TaxID=34765 RepID=A0ABN7SFZ4_OIKDI|nr:Oidioi.mRNA.OKI2018_I69.XSR.g13641.t1.cds [Oikopleura dioica]
MTRIAIIGGTGLEDPDVFQDKTEVSVENTPWGEASTIWKGKLNSVEVFVLSRHGKSHELSPSQVNYCANLWALKQLGVTHVIATTACGSLREEYAPGDLVVVSDYIDMTKTRTYTHFGTSPTGPKGIAHVPAKPALDEGLRQMVIKVMKDTDVSFKENGTCVVIEGPRFSTLAESKMYSSFFGGDIVNMTLSPEAAIAKEMKLHYASIALVTDYDCWKESEEVSVEKVLKQMKTNARNAVKVLQKLIPLVAEKDWTAERNELTATIDGSVM